MASNNDHVIFWFRRDLRLHDNHGLFKALNSGEKVQPLFIFDSEILEDLSDRKDPRLGFIHDCLSRMDEQLRENGGSLKVLHGKPEELWKELSENEGLKAVYTNHDYEPYAKERDNRIAEILSKKEIEFHTFKDQVIFEKDEVVKDDGNPYTVYTPFSKKWKSHFSPDMVKPFPSEKHLDRLVQDTSHEIPSLKDIGFEEPRIKVDPPEIDKSIIKTYDETRNFPANEAGTTRLSVHLRFGTVSIRKLMDLARKTNEVWWNELIWREFYMMILWHFPHVVENNFRAKYDAVKWREDEDAFEKWKEGKTGYPMVDAGMRELNESGFMHNRVRMVVASFLCKHLLIDWRWGEAYFAEKLLDYELASNNGGWQWAAGTGCDAAPYFRIFNPESQMKKFDPKGRYVLRWVPEYGTPAYPKPIVEHKMARERALETYKEALN